jgi:hypothetical protein
MDRKEVKRKEDGTPEGRAGRNPVPSPSNTTKEHSISYFLTCHASAPDMAKVIFFTIAA